MYVGIAGKAMVSNNTLAWLGNRDVRPRTNSSMLRDPDVTSGSQLLVHQISRVGRKI